MCNFRVIHRSSQAGIFVLVVKPWEVIKVHVSMYISMLGIGIKLYGHVLGPPDFSFNPEKINFPVILGHFLGPFFFK